MKIHYYLGWFNEYFPDKLAQLLNEDITNRKSIVMISANPSLTEDEGICATERSWLDHANLVFDEYHLIDYGIERNEAKKLILNASVIFLLGGNTIEQNEFLVKYELSDAIKKSRAIVMGASAGAINMSAKWLYWKNIGNKVEVSTVYSGVSLDEFSVLSHYDLENNFAIAHEVLSPLSEEMDVYVSNKDCAVRVKDGIIDILGNVYLISQSKIHKLDETL